MRKIMTMAGMLLLLSGCATLQNKNQLRAQTLGQYGAALRWSGFASAWSFVDPAVRAAHPLTPQRKALYNTVQVAEYDASGPVATGTDTVQQTARIRVTVNANQHVYTVVDHQTWHWDTDAKHWWLESGLPDIARPH
jgi:uncharacterized protein YceK